ncbi:potassium channel family protein [Clostridium sp. WILCCON 0269]|uniref:Potassium channel family protein n=1 Tax=Candidatus Clostridium eludens TaxID=3381663 RepID=A0ABW8SNS9_9CLOT
MRYDVKIHKDKPFIKTIEVGEGIKRSISCKSSVKIKFYNDDGSVSIVKRYGYITADKVTEDIRTEKDIILDGCYVKDLVLSGLNITTLFSSQYTFFDGTIDFSEAAFNKEANFAYATFSEEVDFNRASFNEDEYFSCVTFSKKADFSQVNFSANAYFAFAKFNGEACFYQAKFGEETSFFGSIFSEQVSFGATKFSEEMNFAKVTFSKETNFMSTTFRGKADFSSAIFNGKIDLIFAVFSKQANFVFTTFSERADFGGATFSEEIYFNDSSIKEQIIFDSVVFSTRVDMKFNQCHSLVMKNCSIEKTLDLGSARFNSLCFENTKNLGQIFIDWERNNIKEAICKYAKEHKLYHHTVAKQFLMFKENFNRLGQYDDEDSAYVEYKRGRAKSEFFNENGLNKGFKRIIHKHIVYPFKWFVFDYIGSYATAPLRIFKALCLNIICFAVIYLLLGVHIEKLEKGILGNGILARFLEVLYFSAITSFTVGYGDISPERFLVAGLACVESFIGVFLMSYFTVAFARKILR